MCLQPFALLLQTFQCCDSNNIQRDREDWLGICRQSWHQAVHRTSLCEGHIQHLPFLPGGAHEGHRCLFHNCVKQNSHYADEVYFMDCLCLHKSGRRVYTQCCLCLGLNSDLFRRDSVQMFVKLKEYMCLQCRIIYPREQLFTIFELETMGFAESEVSEHSLNLWNIAVWVLDLRSDFHYALTSNSKRNRGQFILSLFAPRKSKGLSGRALRKLPFLAHALFVKVNVYFCTEENDGKTQLVILKMHSVCLQTMTVTLTQFLEAMNRAVDVQKEEKANLINCVWTSCCSGLKGDKWMFSSSCLICS